MGPIYVTGHKNPDVDSIVSAIAYAALKSSLGERDVMPVRLGEVNAETMIVLDRFGFEPPELISSVKTQLSDVTFDRPPVVGSGVTVRTAWSIMIDSNVQSVCIADESGKLAGMIATSDIAEHDMNSALNGFFVSTNAFNLASSVEGFLIGAGDDWDLIEGPVNLAVGNGNDITADRVGGSVVIAGDRKDIVERVEKAKAACLVLCEVDAQSEVARAAAAASIPVILTHYDAYRASRLISHSVPVSSIMNKHDVPFFHITDYIDDVREVMLQNRAPSYPVVDEDERVIGMLTRFHLLNHARKRVILVDHNEPEQSVPGLEQSELLEILDHHRLGDVQTDSPVSIRMEPVGSTTTIVASLFFEHGVTPSKTLAGLISAGIVSDTVIFKSPTCTEKDKRMAYRMAQLAGIELEKLGEEIFSAASNIVNKSAEELLFNDYKEFSIGERKIGIGQVTCMDVSELDDREDELFKEMEKVKVAREMDMVILMETDIVKESSRLLFIGQGADVLIAEAFQKPVENRSVYLEGVMSRKKQVVPAISAQLAE